VLDCETLLGIIEPFCELRYSSHPLSDNSVRLWKIASCVPNFGFALNVLVSRTAIFICESSSGLGQYMDRAIENRSVSKQP